MSLELVMGRQDFKIKIEEMTKRQSRPCIPDRPRIEEKNAAH